MKKINLNEELINQLRLMSFDRSKTLLEQNERRITLYGQIFNGMDGKPCDGCNVKLYKNPNYFASKLNNHPYYENLFKNESPMNSTTTYDGYYTIGELDINPGPYALVANGATTRDYTTIYFNVINSGTLTNNIQLYNYTQDLPIYTKFGGELGKVYNKWVQSVNKYNQLIDNNHTNNRYTYNFPDPQKVSADHKWTVNEMKGYVDGVQKSINDLNKTINKGEDYLKDAGKYINVTKLKPLDVVKEFGTTEGFSEMHGLYSIGGNAVNLWRDWMNNDGEYLDPKSVKLTPEQIEYIKQGGKRKLEKKWKDFKWEDYKDEFLTGYHEASPYLAMLLWVIPGGQIPAIAIEGIDALIYATYDENYYMAGLTALFTLTGAIDEFILGGPAGKKVFMESVKRFTKKKVLTSTQKDSLKYFLKQALPKVALQASKIIIGSIEKIFKLMKRSYAWARYIIGELWIMIDVLPPFLKTFVESVVKMTVMVGGVVWTWDLISYFSDICNTQDFTLASKTWNDSDHWWITNLLLGDILVPYMGWAQSWSTPCGKLQLQASTNEEYNKLSEKGKENLKVESEKENTSNEKSKIVRDFGKEVEKTKNLYKDSLPAAKSEMLNKVIEEEKKIINFRDSIPENFSDPFLLRWNIFLEKLEKEKGVPKEELSVDSLGGN